MAQVREILLAAIDEAFDQQSWHGPNLRGSVRGITPKEAAWRPDPERHNVWELLVHAAYWKYAVRRRITRSKRGTFALKGSNFFRRPEKATAAAWKMDLDLLDTEHRLLREAVAYLPEYALEEGRTLHLIRGAAAHDLYHAGQIRLLRRMAKASG